MAHARDLALRLTHRARAASFLVLVVAALVGCATERAEKLSDTTAPRDTWWASLQQLCGRAFSGTLVEGNPSDSAFRGQVLRMHVRQCLADTIRIPFHLGPDRSRTWVLTRSAEGLRLKHDHRHEDGSEDSVTQYGGDTRDAGSATRQEFAADSHTAELIPAARTNVWAIEVVPGEVFAYALRREGTDRKFRVEFDLTRPVEAPPAPWGYAPLPGDGALLPGSPPSP